MGRLGDHVKREASVDAVAEAGTSSIAPASGLREVDRQRRTSAWAVTNEYFHDGFQYRIMRRPAERAEAYLTPREEEALALAYGGLGNRRIAEQLRVAASTVGVLLFRAGRKFGVRTRAELLAAYAKLKGLSETETDHLHSRS